MKRQIFMSVLLFAMAMMISMGVEEGTTINVIAGNGGAICNGKLNGNTGVADDPMLLDLKGDGVDLGGQAKTGMLGGDARIYRWTKPKSDDAFVLIDATSIRLAKYEITSSSGVKLAGLILLRDGVQLRTPDGRIVAIRDVWQFFSALDANRDGWLDSKDAPFGHLRTWSDIDANGEIDAGKVRTLSDCGVQSISTQNRARARDKYGNLRSDGTYRTTEGATRLATGVILATIR